jgi:hypothetical protein
MSLFKMVLSFLLLSGHPEMDQDGWVTIERPKKEAEALGADERDPSIWVVFSKQLGLGKMVVRFPDEPSYRYARENKQHMEIFSTADGIEYRVEILDERVQSIEELLKIRVEQVGAQAVAKQQIQENRAELIHWKDGFWLQETLIKSDQHTFFLQTKSADIESDAHRTFVKSFELHTL